MRYLLAALFSFVISTTAYAQEATPTPASGDGEGRVWTLEEIFSEKATKAPKGKVKYCKGGRFEPCVCTPYVSRLARYRPAIAECDGKAGIVLSGKYTNVYSVVVRDTDNRDRWPESGFQGCTDYETNVLALNKCSAFKTQDRFKVVNGKRQSSVFCLGASGYSTLFRKVARITVKLADDPTSNNDPLVRWCLKKPGLPLN